MPFLPTLIESLERHGHLCLTDACRAQLLSMSAATADRLLRSRRGQHPHGVATTQVGTLLKQQIPTRTFQQWNEQEPGFLEADLVAHCGPQAQGSFLYTLTLTDIATGWTECFPLLTKSAEAVVSALQLAQACFPFPILGLDTDNGCEFINEHLLVYCVAAQITFTRGREGFKNDQCFVEQKNGAIVRQVIGYARLEGERAYEQLGEVYQALRLYVNGFQPSMKLQAKQYNGRKVRRIYDVAKTPLQRLLLSKVLPASKEHELLREAQVLDPLRLFHHLQDLQQALLSSTPSMSPPAEGPSPVAVLPFCVQRCIGGPKPADPQSVETPGRQQVILAGASLSASLGMPEQRTDHRAQASTCTRACTSAESACQQPAQASVLPAQRRREEEGMRRQTMSSEVAVGESSACRDGSPQASHAPVSPKHSHRNLSALTIEQAIQEYLEDRSRQHRRPKTLEWHQKALGLFQHYLQTEHKCVLLAQMTQAQVCGWLEWLPQIPTVAGHPRSSSTVESYARSVRAFCHWLVRHRYLPATPFAHLLLPRVEIRLFHGKLGEYSDKSDRILGI